MTTYQHSLVLNDSEYIALQAALSLMMEHCDNELSAGAGAPFWSHKQSCIAILARLRSSAPQMTSTSSICRRDD